MVEGDFPDADAAAPVADPLLGKVLSGRFTILEAIGNGGMGRVYKALQAPLDRLVALKVLNPTYSAGKDPGFQKRFFLEASLTAKLHHPNTITVHDYGRTDDGIFYIAMEFLEGQTLQALLAQAGALPWDRAVHIGGQVCRSLREAHKLGILHRDLKPANVMVLNEETERDMIKVLDFGLVKPFLPDHPKNVDETELTQAGVLLGSPLYMAPEQARNQSDPRSDIYSLGVVLYQMIAGRTPFQGKESIDVIVKHIRELPPPIRSLKPEVPPEIEAVVMRCLEKDPPRRYQSMDELLEALRTAAAAAGLSGVWSRPNTGVLSALPNGGSQLSATDLSATRVDNVGRSPLPGAQQSQPSGKKLFIGLFVGSLAIGALAAFGLLQNARGRSTVKPERPMPPSATARPRPTPTQTPPNEEAEPITFDIRTTPHGARVSMDGTVMGVTPIELTRPPGPTGVAQMELTFQLEGYQSATVTATGAEPRVELHHELVKKKPAVARPAKPKNTPAGYKDDPYQ